MAVFGMVIIVKNSVLQKQMQTIGFQKSRRTRKGIKRSIKSWQKWDGML